MKKNKNKISYFEGKSTQLMMFYSMVIIEMFAMFVIALLQLIMRFKTDSIIPMFASIAYLLVILFLSNIYPNKLSLFKALTLLPMLLLVIPYLFMGTEGGGIESGMPIWMVLGLLMIFLFAKGVYFVVLFIVTLFTYIGCLVYAYLNLQDSLGNLEKIYYYQDNVMAIVAVSVSCGMIIKYHQWIEDKSKQKIEQEKLKAQNANEAKSRFLASMSHDIRTPMNAIMGMTEMANYYIDDKEKVQECLKKISDSSSILLHLINNVLDMSEIENHELKLKETPFDMYEVVEKLQVVLEQTAASKKLTLEVSCEHIENNRLIGDVVRLRQVLMNLLSNSLKFTQAGGKVSLTISQKEGEENGYALFLIEVRDTGIGMKQEFIDNMLFKPFERDETQYVNKTEGNGLGMSITKNILDVMGADLNIESELGKGTAFIINMRLKIDNDINVNNPSEEDFSCNKIGNDTNKCALLTAEKNEMLNLEGKRLLVVEDNEINMEIIVSILERMKGEVVQAWNGEEALEVFEKSEEGFFDLIFFDIQLPGMSGYEAVKILREMKRSDAARIPILAMTANAFSNDVEQALLSGMNDHISKPIDIDVLCAKIKEILSC